MTGDSDDILFRLQATLPPWFPDDSPVAQGVLAGCAAAAAFIYSLLGYAQAQTRILTATDGWLDLIAGDFFGSRFVRQIGEADDAFRGRIIPEILRERTTRNGVRQALIDLTGRVPKIFEPRRPLDTGAYGTNSLGYGVAGGYGSLLLPYQAFITAYRPLTSGIPLVNGYGQPAGGYGVGSESYADIDDVIGAVTDADIYARIDDVKPAASIMWTQLSA